MPSVATLAGNQDWQNRLPPEGEKRLVRAPAVPEYRWQLASLATRLLPSSIVFATGQSSGVFRTVTSESGSRRSAKVPAPSRTSPLMATNAAEFGNGQAHGLAPSSVPGPRNSLLVAGTGGGGRQARPNEITAIPGSYWRLRWTSKVPNRDHRRDGVAREPLLKKSPSREGHYVLTVKGNQEHFAHGHSTDRCVKAPEQNFAGLEHDTYERTREFARAWS